MRRAEMGKEFVQTIFARRSIRKYTDEPVSEADIKTLLEAAMAAPSASNRKPWQFVVVTKRQTLDALAEAHPHGKMLFEAPLCISVCGDLTEMERYWVQDCSAATENLLLAVTALDLGAVWLGITPKEDRVTAVREILGLPDHITPLNLVSIGHPAEEKDARTQYDASRVHHEGW
jgi:nitroreductase